MVECQYSQNAVQMFTAIACACIYSVYMDQMQDMLKHCIFTEVLLKLMSRFFSVLIVNSRFVLLQSSIPLKAWSQSESLLLLLLLLEESLELSLLSGFFLCFLLLFFFCFLLFFFLAFCFSRRSSFLYNTNI